MSTKQLLNKFMDPASNVKDEQFYKEVFRQIHSKVRTNSLIKDDCIGLLAQEEIVDVANTINQLASEVRDNASIMIIVGEGESYIDAQHLYEEMEHLNNLSASPELFFVGSGKGSDYINQLIDYIGLKDVYLYVISSSGDISAQSIWFRYMSAYMERRYGSESTTRIIVSANTEKSIFKRKSTEREMRTFVLPTSKEGSSILPPVALLPVAVAGCDIVALLNGAKLAVLD